MIEYKDSVFDPHGWDTEYFATESKILNQKQMKILLVPLVFLYSVSTQRASFHCLKAPLNVGRVVTQRRLRKQAENKIGALGSGNGCF